MNDLKSFFKTIVKNVTNLDLRDTRRGLKGDICNSFSKAQSKTGIQS